MQVQPNKQRITIVTDVPFWQQQRGSHRRIAALRQYFQRHAEVDVYFVGQLTVGEWLLAEEVLSQPLYGPGRPGWLHRQLVRLISKPVQAAGDQTGAASPPKGLSEYASPEIGNHFARYIRQRIPAAIVIEYITLAFLTRYIPSALRDQIRVAIDTHDTLSKRADEFQRHNRVSWLSVSPEEEAQALGECDCVVAIQEHDARYFELLLSQSSSPDRAGRPPPRVVVAKHPMPWQGNRVSRSMDDSKIRVGFIGSDGEANRLGIATFLNDVAPEIVRKLQGEVEFLIAGPLGPLPSADTLALRGRVRLQSCVDIARDFYSLVDIVINPVDIHSGLKIKSLEALAFGKPLVATTAAAAGLESGRNRCLLATDNWGEFADHVVTLANSKPMRERFTKAARELVEREFGMDVVFAALKQELIGVST